jgi:hypothetical protein
MMRTESSIVRWRITRATVALALACSMVAGIGFQAGASVGDHGQYVHPYYWEEVGGADWFRCASGYNNLDYDFGGFGLANFNARTESRKNVYCIDTRGVAASNIASSDRLYKLDGSGIFQPCTSIAVGNNATTTWVHQFAAWPGGSQAAWCGNGTYKVVSGHTVYINGTPRSTFISSKEMTIA